MELYWTGLVHLDVEIDLSLVKGRGWSVDLDNRFNTATHDQLSHWREAGYRIPPQVQSQQGSCCYAPELIISAPTQLIATKALNLITACQIVADGELLGDVDDLAADPDDPLKNGGIEEKLRKGKLPRAGIGAHGFRYGCEMAARASRRLHWQCAVHKLSLSFHTVSPLLMEVNPRFAPKRFGIENDFREITRMANAITLAYSAIEEVQLEIHASAQNPSLLPNKQWNPTVLTNLLYRLRSSHTDGYEKVNWAARGTPTLVERSKRNPLGGTKAKWARHGVRDRSIPVVDALLDASRLRSKATTHRSNTTTRSLTMYDVHNVQILARHLMLNLLKMKL